MSSVAPEMNDASSDKSQAIGPATSSTRPVRPTGIDADISPNNAGSWDTPAVISVMVKPGRTEIARIPSRA
ncbi:MAG TPA: hypothetical protein VIU29_07590, partial [Candidatus Deferrimicrobiaceae bacterium]